MSYLESYRQNDIKGRVVQPPPPVEIEGDFEHEVEAIVDSRVRKNQPQTFRYRVRWRGYNNPDDDTWEPLEHLLHCADLVQEFHIQYPSKPHPQSSAD